MLRKTKDQVLNLAFERSNFSNTVSVVDQNYQGAIAPRMETARHVPRLNEVDLVGMVVRLQNQLSTRDLLKVPLRN